MLTRNGFIIGIFKINYYIHILNFSVLILNMENTDKYDSHKQKLLRGLQKILIKESRN